ncbi:FMN-dependent dehydrogenase, includes L-lactate dehydrogenase and type II isopentenyl diphosphate isomerase [Rhodococcus triatomae]|uniref:FMN-dependent dehydrogenase, includes L-lactate dehydrogenase and type II isopentenyl diphosphate isomerase n=1 Tax=Rhodococcus triatomae TaxID=300028 RepID=A0A1G8GWV8_9NOCA|nr:lactate 2-monooxygenase [Rhodococcus triatomae]SDH98710.1 FMN-dependent dehydrogenase, includes L-lactate dehydrogenase and type II isopentenyl diphosphate isomerase [Rhodococcus triatomae]
MSTQESAGRARQNTIYRDGVFGKRPSVPTDFAGLEAAARRKMSPKAWAYVHGGAGSGSTMSANRAAFDRWQIVPRVLRDVSERDLGVELFGRRLPAPVLLAPVGAAELAHPDADVAIASAAGELGVPYIFSNQGCAPMEESAAAMGDAPRWFQLYWSTDDDLVDSFLDRARRISADAIVVTLDTTMLGWRPEDLNLGSLPFAQGQGIAQYTSDPVFRRIVRERIAAVTEKPEVKVTLGAVKALLSMTSRYPGRFLDNLRSPEPRAAVETFLDIYSRPSLSWSDIESLRERTSLPVLLKGVLHPDDARRAIDAGVDGLVVSNHGGRQVDGSVAALDALTDIAPVVDGRLKLVLDSGIRSGADVFKALALGADAVTLGRPHLYGLALAGRDGVRDVTANLLAEFDLTVGLSGLTSVAEIDRDALRRV